MRAALANGNPLRPTSVPAHPSFDAPGAALGLHLHADASRPDGRGRRRSDRCGVRAGRDARRLQGCRRAGCRDAAAGPGDQGARSSLIPRSRQHDAQGRAPVAAYGARSWRRPRAGRDRSRRREANPRRPLRLLPVSGPPGRPPDAAGRIGRAGRRAFPQRAGDGLRRRRSPCVPRDRGRPARSGARRARGVAGKQVDRRRQRQHEAADRRAGESRRRCVHHRLGGVRGAFSPDKPSLRDQIEDILAACAGASKMSA